MLIKLKIIIVPALIIASLKSAAGDSAELYKIRINKIKELYDWLSKRPYDEVNIMKADTASRSWRSYDTAINLFFNRPVLDSLYQNRGKQNDIFSTSDKFLLLKQFIAAFHDLTQHECFKNLKFKSTDTNSIKQFFVIDKHEFGFILFGFRNNTADLIGLLESGFAEPDYRIFKKYYDSLKPCSR